MLTTYDFEKKLSIDQIRTAFEEDTPRSVGYQAHLLARTGFVNIEILHKQACFAAFGGIKEE